MVITMDAQGGLGHARSRRPARTASGMALAVVLLCLPALAGCGAQDEDEALVQRVAFCQGPSSDNPNGDPVDIEFRQGSRVVARTSGSVGTAFTVEVPWGPVQIYVNGVRKGSVDEGVSADTYRSPGPDDVTYIATAEGCPDSAPLPPPGR